MCRAGFCAARGDIAGSASLRPVIAQQLCIKTMMSSRFCFAGQSFFWLGYANTCSSQSQPRRQGKIAPNTSHMENIELKQKLVNKPNIAIRYGVSTRTIQCWME
jgi:hypothetical protein